MEEGHDTSKVSPVCSYNALGAVGGTFCDGGVPGKIDIGCKGGGVCNAWVPAQHYCGLADDCPTCDTGNCGAETCDRYRARIYKNGYCSRIEAAKIIAERR